MNPRKTSYVDVLRWSDESESFRRVPYIIQYHEISHGVILVQTTGSVGGYMSLLSEAQSESQTISYRLWFPHPTSSSTGLGMSLAG